MNGIERFYNEVHQRVTDEIIRGLFFSSSVTVYSTLNWILASFHVSFDTMSITA